MEDAIADIVGRIGSGYIFDSHYVVFQLREHYSDAYNAYMGGIDTPNSAHAHIGKKIDRLEEVTQLDKSWSRDINGVPCSCTAWRKS